MHARCARSIGLSPGRIETREYSVARPRYAGYALIAIGLWLIGGIVEAWISACSERSRNGSR